MDTSTSMEGAPPRAARSATGKQVARRCHRQIEELLRRQAVSTAEFCRNEAGIGARYLEAQAALGRFANMDEWLADLPGLTPRRAQYCAKLSGVFDRFPDAHEWHGRLTPEQRAEGWRTANETGVRYALQVIALHARFLDGKPPPKVPAPVDRKVASDRKETDAVEQRDMAIGDAIAARNALADTAVEKTRLARQTRTLARGTERLDGRQRAMAADIAGLARRCAKLKRDNARLRAALRAGGRGR